MSAFAKDVSEILAKAEDPYPCSVCAALIAMGNDDKEALRALLVSTIGAERVSIILRRNGHPSSKKAVMAHRLAKEGHAS